jgi:hypothetical protein
MHDIGIKPTTPKRYANIGEFNIQFGVIPQGIAVN